MRMATILFWLAATSVLAEDIPADEPQYEKPSFERPTTRETSDASEDSREERTFLPTYNATAILARLGQIQKTCERVGEEYRVDCLARTYRSLANDIRNSRGDSIVQSTLMEAARKLDDLVESNLDAEKRVIRAHLMSPLGQKVLSTPPLRAVRAGMVDASKRDATNVLEEAQTTLLRSASDGSSKALVDQRIAASLGSNKVLLRSA